MTSKALFAALFALMGGHSLAAEGRIQVSASQLLNESVLGDANLLVDEQAAIGDPSTASGLRPVRPYFPGWTVWRYPAHVLLDLKAKHKVTKLFVYNESGEADLTVSVGSPFVWVPKPFHLGGYRTWCELSLNAETRYLRLTLKSPHEIAEIAIYGEPLETPAVAVTAKSPPRLPVTFDQFLGTNAFIDDPLDALSKPVGLVREYHNWGWDVEGPGGDRRFQPSGAAGGNAWFFDDFYARLKALGVTVCPAIQGTNDRLFSGAKQNDKPIMPGTDSESPASYAAHSEHLFQFAARYGASKVPDRMLVLGKGQPRKSGLGTLQFLENWNEPDQTWNGRPAYFGPYELAAMCSADYDGDQGRMGPGHGVKAADPRMRLVMAGLADSKIDYLRAMKLWADHYRNGSFPADVINNHHYSHDGNDGQGFKTTGLSPEADRLEEKMAEFVAWRDANVPKAELWVTEFGYDSSPGSPLKSPAIGSYSGEEVQAAWIVRGYFALAQAKVDRAIMFMFRNVKDGDPGVFATSGMVTEKGRWVPKPSYLAVMTLKQRLKGMRLAGVVKTKSTDVQMLKFVGEGRTAFAVWCKTSSDLRVPGITVPLKAGISVDLITGKESGLPTRQGLCTVEAREMPLLVIEPWAGKA